MDPGRFQFDRDPISATEQFTNTKQARRTIFFGNLPETVEHFLGRPHFIIFIEPPSYSEKSFIDCHNLLEKASHLLELGAEKPLFAKNNLERLALGLNLVRVVPESTQELQVLTKLGKDEAMTYWETDFLAVARWLTYFDDFQLLPHAQQVLLLKSVWHVWSRLDKLSLTASGRRQNICEKRQMMLGWNSACDPKTVDLDISWFTKYPREQLAFFGFPDEMEEWLLIDALEPLMELQPSDIELTYMLCQLCFHYAGKKYQGEILEVTEKFQDILANDLHNYYTNELNMPRYCGRLNQMLKINNMIQQDIWEKRAKQEIAKIFDVYCIEFSHPEMFEDASRGALRKKPYTCKNEDEKGRCGIYDPATEQYSCKKCRMDKCLRMGMSVKNLPIALRMKIFTGVWHIFAIFDRLTLNFIARKNGFASDENIFIPGYNTYFDFRNLNMNLIEFSKNEEEISKRFIYSIDWYMINFIKPLLDLNPNDVELTFMTTQFCFNYVGKRFQGEIQEITEKFQEMLANDLHDYYVNDHNNMRYSARLGQLMKFVRSLENDFLEKQQKVEVGEVFDVWKVEFSHPEVFKDNLC
ncbi:CBN-NHR-130 protein [Caenorhabditis brenneri]|uniref:CBN-NHR-130 protein n=1 Tax=Caenorhabditis brenneri TaxID=135651 RepID=G0NEN3_CAEBE|nr:CBN-NHR-130 protein [Caenorhabditis brenneri]